jgi:hypothetical protein
LAVDSVEHVYLAYASVTTTTSSKKNPPSPVYTIQVASLNAASGSTLWSGSMGSYGIVGADIAIDGAGNVYVTGGGNPFFVAKFVPVGTGSLTQSWNDKISGDNWASGVAVGQAGNVYVTGSFTGSVDFDPGTGTYILQSASNLQTIGRVVYQVSTTDVFLSELDTNGTLLAAVDIVSGVSPNNLNNFGRAIALDRSGNIYTTGGFRGTANFDSNGTYDLAVNGGSNSGAQDVFLSQLTQPSSAGGAAAPSAPESGSKLAALLASSSISLGRFVESSNPLPAAGEGGTPQEQTQRVPVGQAAFGTRLPSADPTTIVHPALRDTTSPVIVDRLFTELMGDALRDALVTRAPLGLLV